MPRGNVSVSITGETRGLQRATKQAETSLGRLSKEGTKHTHALAGSVASLALSFAGPAGLALGIESVVSAAAKQQKVNAQLDAQLRALNISYKAHAKQIEEVIKKTSELSGLDDEDLKSSFVNIVRVTGDVSKSLKLTGLAADFARAKHIDVAKAGEIVGKVAGGNIGILSRYGITIKKGADATEALGLLQQKFKGQAEAYGKTTAGATDRAHVAFENLREVLGTALLPILTKVADKTATFVNQMADGTGAGGRFVDKLKAIADAIKPIVKFFTDHPRLIAIAVGAWATYRLAAAAALTVTRLKLIGTFVGLGPKAAAGGAVAGRSFGTAASTAADTKMRGFKWGALGRFIGLAIAAEIVNAALPTINELTGGGLSGNDVQTPTKRKIFNLQQHINRPGYGTQYPKLHSHGASGGVVGGPEGAGDIIPAMLKPGEVVLNQRQQALVGSSRIFGALRATGGRMIGPGGRAATGGYAAMVRTANAIDSRHYPYLWGGGHNGSFSGPYDCSGAVSAVLHAGGIIDRPYVSGEFARMFSPGAGKVTLFANSEHVYMRLGSNYFGTSRSNPAGGAGWFPGAPRAGFAVRHIPESLLGGGGSHTTKAGDGSDKGVRGGGLATNKNSKGKIGGSSSAGFPAGAGGQITSTGTYVGGISPVTGMPLIGGSMGDLGVSTAPEASPYNPDTSDPNQGVIDALKVVIGLLQQQNDDRQKILDVSQRQYPQIFGHLLDAISGGIGGRVGLGFQTPSSAGVLASY